MVEVAAVGLSGAALGAGGGAAVGYGDASIQGRYGISEEFMEQAGGMVQPGQSAPTTSAVTAARYFGLH